jgi:HK97 gp10 family phage protein
MSGVKFQIKGANEMVRSLEHMDVEAHAKARTVFEVFAKKIEADAKRNAPVSHKKNHEGGTLRRSITSKVDANPVRIEARIGTKTYYAPYQEDGTSRGIPALHYLRNAFESNKEPFIAALKAAINSLRW